MFASCGRQSHSSQAAISKASGESHDQAKSCIGHSCVLNWQTVLAKLTSLRVNGVLVIGFSPYHLISMLCSHHQPAQSREGTSCQWQPVDVARDHTACCSSTHARADSILAPVTSQDAAPLTLLSPQQRRTPSYEHSSTRPSAGIFPWVKGYLMTLPLAEEFAFGWQVQALI